jgi:hypothetical protein
VTAPGAPGWWDSFVDGFQDIVHSLNRPIGFDPLDLKDTGLDLPKAAREVVTQARENPRKFLLEQIGTGTLGAVGKQAAGKPAVRKLLAALQAEGGATLEASGKPHAGAGYAVADPDLTAIVSTPKEMRAFLGRRDVLNALSAGKRIGKWTDPETGKTEINITDILDDMKAAQKLAAQRGEQAIGHLGESGEYLGDVRNPHAPVNAVKDLLAGMRVNEPMKRIAEIPSTRGKQLAEAYEGLPKNDPAAKEAYDALNLEVADQLKRMKDAGYTIEYTDADPYKNSAEMMADVRENKTLKVFKTPEGGDFHPYMTPEQNNQFRAVHDFLAHAGGGNQFGPVGEENAYRVHASTLSKLAQRALASETRGQNSWVNFGPNAHLPVKDRPFAEQKAALWPEGLLGDYESMGMVGGQAPEHIVSATVRIRGKEWDGPSHMDAGYEAEVRRQGGDFDWEGFRTSTGRLVSREEAAKIAKKQKQLLNPETFGEDPTVHNIDLLSEDVAGLREGELRAPAVRVNNDWKPTERGVFDRAPERGVPATEYREPAELPFQTESRPRAGATDLAQQIATDPRVEKRNVSDMEKGLGLGGRGWYGLLPLRRYFEQRQGPISFDDFNMAGAAGSARTPTHNELTNASILMYAKKHGISHEDARQAFLKKFPGTMRPTFMGMHGQIFDRAQKAGFAGPAEPSSGSLKIPNYYHDRMLKATGVPIDTHEMRMMAQALGINEEDLKAALVDADSYNLATEPYRRVAKRFGLHEDQVQAGRWIGGGKQTGLKSQPKGDFTQTVEDGLLYTAQQQGLDESPRGLRSLWDRIAGGDDFFLPFGGEGGFPVYGDKQQSLF